MATETQTKLVGFCLGNKTNYNATAYANHIWFDPTNKQILLNGIEYIPKKLSELVNDSGFLTSITKSMVENVLTGNITSHTHSAYVDLSSSQTITGQKNINTATNVKPFIISRQGRNDYELLNIGVDDTFVIFNHVQDEKVASYKFIGKWLDVENNAGGVSAGSAYIQFNLGSSGSSISVNGTNVSLEGHTHSFASITSKPTTLGGYGITDAALASDLSKYLPLTGGTLSGALTCNGYCIDMNNDSGSRGYRGFFNQSNSTSRASGSHIFMKGGGEALGTNSVSIGYHAYAGIRNQDADKGTYPYIAWQWMPSVKVNFTTTNQDTALGEFYGYEVLGGKMVQYELGGNTYTYENTSTSVRVLVCVKDDADTGLIFGGKSYMPFNATKTLIEGKYILGRGESITNVNTITVGEVNYYVLAIYTWSATVGYDYSTQVKVMCATKVNNSNYNGASSYASGYASVASGDSSVASGAYSVASGYASVASGYYSVASGNYSVASGYASVASGQSSVASGQSSVASGYASVASGSYSVASGYASVASGESSVASGYYSVASGDSSVASGAYSVASGYYSVASGYASVASGNFSVVLARNGETQSSYQTIIGRYNAKVAGLFIIGNGSSSARSNAFVVDESGNVTARYFSGYANAVGGEGFKIYPENTNQINFGGTGSDTTVVFGAASKDSRSVPTTYKFGANGTATIQAAAFTGNASTSTKSEYSRSLLGRNTSGNDYPAISANLVFAEWNTMNDNRWYLKANGYECRVAHATSATKLGASSVGSATQPIYLNGGTPTACSYTLAKSVPSNAVFTDTTYSVATATTDGLMSSAMFKAKMVKSVSVRQGGTAVIGGGTITNHSVYITQDKNNITDAYQQAIGANDVKIPNATTTYDGSMSYTDKRKLDNVHNNCVAASVYVLNLSYYFTDINGLTLEMANFSGLSAAIASGNRPDMIRLVTNLTTNIFTLYDSTNAINDGSFFYYRCDGKNAEISIEDNQITFSVN